MAVVALAASVLLGCGGATKSSTTLTGVPSAPGDRTDARVIADADGIGGDTSIVVFDDATEFDSWWEELGFVEDRPAFDPVREIMIGFTATYPSGCQYGFSGIEIDEPARIVEARYFGSEPSDSCGADENPFTVVVAIGLAALSTGTWTAQKSVGGAPTSFDVP